MTLGVLKNIPTFFYFLSRIHSPRMSWNPCKNNISPYQFDKRQIRAIKVQIFDLIHKVYQIHYFY